MKLKDAIATYWLRLASARHGILPPIDSVMADAPTAPKVAGLASKLLPLAGAALLGGGLTAAPWLMGLIGGDMDVSPPAQINREGSLLQYLEDRGDHLPL